jgi:hypothetical protein
MGVIPSLEVLAAMCYDIVKVSNEIPGEELYFC